jgi:hypothetical protein
VSERTRFDRSPDDIPTAWQNLLPVMAQVGIQLLPPLERPIMLGLSEHGHLDMHAYDDFLNERLPEVEFDPEEEAAALARVPDVPIG